MPLPKPRQLKPLPRLASVETLTRLAEQGSDGRSWYRVAREQVWQAAEFLDVTPWYYADILSLFSPRVSVIRNVRLTNYYLTIGEFHPSTMGVVRKAVEHYEQTGEIRGPKTSAFARALIGAGDAIVLDVWMAKSFGCDQQQFKRPAVRSVCERRIHKAADALGWTPAETQAAIWTATVRRANRRPGQLTIIIDTLYGRRLEIAGV